MHPCDWTSGSFRAVKQSPGGITANCGGLGRAHTFWQKLAATCEVAMEGDFQGADGKGVDQNKLKEILAKHEAVFDGKLGKVEGTYVTLCVETEAKPKYFKPMSVPYMLKKKIGDKLGRQEREGTISPVEFSQWATAIVPILKADQSVRICVDYKVTINPVTKLDNIRYRYEGLQKVNWYL